MDGKRKCKKLLFGSWPIKIEYRTDEHGISNHEVGTRHAMSLRDSIFRALPAEQAGSLFDILFLRHYSHRNRYQYMGAFSRLGFYFELSSNHNGSFFHTEQTECFSFGCSGIETFAIIGDGEMYVFICHIKNG